MLWLTGTSTPALQPIWVPHVVVLPPEHAPVPHLLQPFVAVTVLSWLQATETVPVTRPAGAPPAP